LVRFQSGAPRSFREDVGKRPSRQAFTLEIAGSNPAVLTRVPFVQRIRTRVYGTRNSGSNPERDANHGPVYRAWRYRAAHVSRRCFRTSHGPVGELESPVPRQGTDRRFKSDRVRQFVVHRMPKRSRRRTATPFLSGSSPDRCFMYLNLLEWCNGSHAGLRNQCLRAWEFESLLQHQILQRVPANGR
jgi:hypothetical protein